MALASSSSVQVRAIKEATFGVTPVTGNGKNLRITGESLMFDISKESSKEINANRTVSSAIPTTAKASGGLNMEMFYAGIDDLLASTLQNAPTVHGVDGQGASVTATSITTSTITAGVAPSGSSAWTTLQKGQWFRIGGAGVTGVNAGKILRVSSTVAPTATVITLDPNTAAVASTSELIRIQTSRLTHGTTQSSWTIERENSDIGVFIAYRGMTPTKFDVKIASASLSAINFDFMGKDGLESDSTTLPGTATAAPVYDVHSGVSGATNAVWLDGAPLAGTFVKSVDLSFDNALRSQEAVGSLAAVGIGSGTINCTLNLSVYFSNKDLFTKFRQNTNASLIFSSTDSAGNGYIFTVPVVNITTWKSNAGAKDQDQLVDITATALNDSGNAVSALQKLLFIDRIGYPETFA